MTDVPIADVEARLTELLALAEAGEEVRLTSRGKPVARLAPLPRPQSSRKPFDFAELERLTSAMEFQEVSAGDFIRAMRDSDRY